MPHVTYASSLTRPRPTAGLKVLFRLVDEETHAQRDKLGGTKVHTEDLGLPAVLERNLLAILQDANKSLPDPLASFMEWKTAFLPSLGHMSSK